MAIPTQPDRRTDLDGTWTLAPDRDRVVRFATRHLFGLAPVKGTFTVESADVRISGGVPTVDARIDAASFDTGHAKRDPHVRSDQFLDVDNHPHVTFRASSAEPTGDGTWRVPGELTARGGTAPLELDARIEQLPPRPDGSALLHLTATGTADRKAHGITRMPGMAGRRLKLELDVHLVRTA